MSLYWCKRGINYPILSTHLKNVKIDNIVSEFIVINNVSREASIKISNYARYHVKYHKKIQIIKFENVKRPRSEVGIVAGTERR